MLDGPPSKAQLHKTFERVLAGLLDGTLVSAPDGNGLDEQTNAALNRVARRKRATEILAARTEFARQLNGQHATEDDTSFAQKLRQVF